MPTRNRRSDKSSAAPARGKNEGEGSRTAARAYNAATRAFVDAGKVDEAAAAARRAMQSPEAASLIAAEAKGKARARH